eukprot:scaffold69_cov198-Alexandrium_tamarense.AAC.10
MSLHQIHSQAHWRFECESSEREPRCRGRGRGLSDAVSGRTSQWPPRTKLNSSRSPTSTMKFINASLLLLQATCLVALSSAASFYRSSVSHRRALTPSRHQQLIINIRGGQLSDGSGGEADGSYHGNYISSGGEPPKAAQAQSVAPVAPVATTQPVTPVQPHVTPAPTSIAGTKSQKLSNFQERAPPAIIMLGATALLLKYLGEKGMIGLVLVMQWAMYRESCAVVEDFNKSNGVNVGDDTIGSFNLQKWWWFATAVMFTSGR